MFARSTVATQWSILAASAAAVLAVVAGLSFRPTGAAEPPASAEPKAPGARAVRGATPYAAIEDEPAPKLIVDPPLPGPLAKGVVWIQWRVENVRILPVFGKGALNVSPRVGHLHVHVDDLPWWWADASDNNTIDLAGCRQASTRC